MTRWERDRRRKETVSVLEPRTVLFILCTRHPTCSLCGGSGMFCSSACWGCWLRSETDSLYSSKTRRASMESVGQQDPRRIRSNIPYDGSLLSLVCLKSRVRDKPRYWFSQPSGLWAWPNLVKISRQGLSALKRSQVLPSECHTLWRGSCPREVQLWVGSKDFLKIYVISSQRGG